MTPNVNFFIGFVPDLTNKQLKTFETKKILEKRKFFSANKKYNFVKYINDGSKTKIDFVDYSSDNEKSTGIFSSKGLLNSNEKDELKNNLSNTKSTIWHGLISFEESFGKKYCNSYEQAFSLMKLEFPKFLKNAGFKVDNIKWFAGLHQNTDHRHIHFSFYEKEPCKYRQGKKGLFFSEGKINMMAVHKAKIDIELKLTSWNLEIKNDRNFLIEQTKDYFQNKAFVSMKVKKSMKDLISILPKNSRLGYESENMKPLRKNIDNVVDLIIKQNPNIKNAYKNFINKISEKDEEIKLLCKSNKVDYKKYLIYEKYYFDIYKRLGNLVVKSLLKLKIEETKNEYQTKNRLKQKRIKREQNNNLLKECIFLSKKIQEDAIQAFEEFEYKLAKANYQRLIEEGIVEL